jgi:Zn-dependent membrane protease YugP
MAAIVARKTADKPAALSAIATHDTPHALADQRFDYGMLECRQRGVHAGSNV